MFRNYQSELLKNYQPNNLVNEFSCSTPDSKLISRDSSKPYEEYNIKGEHVGYFWRQGETLNLEFLIEGEVTVEPSAIVSTVSGETPDELYTSVPAPPRYYNLTDLNSWSCYVDSGVTKWVQDEEFRYPDGATRTVYMPVSKYLQDKTVTVTLYNFRMEEVHAWTPEVKNSKVVCRIDRELSTKLPKGVYYCKVTVGNELVSFTIFDTNDCLLLVK